MNLKIFRIYVEIFRIYISADTKFEKAWDLRTKYICTVRRAPGLVMTDH